MEDIYRQPPIIDPPLMNAAGSLGFAPDLRASIPWKDFGAFLTNPISLHSRMPASGKRWLEFAGGVLLHTGHPNPGFRQVLKQFRARWAQSPLPVIVHLLASDPQEIQTCVLQLEVVENVLAVEIGFPASIDVHAMADILSAAQGELPVIARLSLDRSRELALDAIQAGATAVSLGPPRGSLPSGKGLSHGRIYGPAVYPLALQVVHQLHMMDVAVIGAGGIYQRPQADEMRRAGAWAVQVDLALWRGDWVDEERA